MIEYVLLDVFTQSAFTGNPLAVVLDAADLRPEAMQAVANELNLSETVYLTAEGDRTATWRARIFTPQVELPFAGHPTVGAAVALATSGRAVVVDGRADLVLTEGVGDVAVEVGVDDGGESGRARFRVPTTPERIGPVERAEAAASASLGVEDLHTDIEPATWSAGVPFTIVPVVDADALGRSRGAAGAEHVYAMTPLDGGPPDATTWRARMFAPAMGIAEDPATGAAASAAAGLLASLDDGATPSRTWTIEQGVEMGRPSRIDVSVDRRGPGGGDLIVRVGGAAVVVGGGRLILPSAP